MNITYATTGFARDAAYTADLLKVITEFTDEFPGLETLNVTIKELSLYMLNPPESEKYVFTEDGRSGEVTLPVWKHYDAKGKPTSTPDPYDVFTKLRDCLNRASLRYRSKFGERK